MDYFLGSLAILLIIGGIWATNFLPGKGWDIYE